MKRKNWKMKINLILIFTLILSFFAPMNSIVTKAAEPITVAEAIANNSGTATVQGYIVGYTTGTNKYTKDPAKFAGDTNLAIADSPEETDPSKIIPVELKNSGTYRATYGLKTNPGNLGKKVLFTGTLTAYFLVPGLKDLSAANFIEETSPNKAEAVKASVAAGGVIDGTKVSLSSGTENATIYYTIDGSTPTSSSTQYTESITITKDMTIKAIALASGLDNSDIASFEYKIISLKSIAEVRKMTIGSSALTSGVVTAVFTSGTNNTVYIQEDTAGIVIYGSNLAVEAGDKISAKGTLADYNTLLELNVQKADVTILKKESIPVAEKLTAAQFEESKEAKLVTVKDVTVESVSNGTFIGKDGEGASLTLRPQDATLLSVGTTYDSITGVLGSYKGVYQLIPRSTLDIIQDANKVQTVVATPGTGFIKAGETVTLTSGTADATIYYTTDGQEPTKSSAVYTKPITINEATTLKTFAVKSGLTDGNISTFTYTISKGDVRIHDIQGAGHTSPYLNQNVTDIEGIVVSTIDNNNFFIQDQKPDNDINTSEGILVYKSANGVKIGDVVKVSGTVKEYVMEGYSEKATTDLPVTEISASAITVEKNGQTLPDPIVIGKDRTPPTGKIDSDGLTVFNPEVDGIDFYESLEGMLVQLDSPKVVAPQEYGEVVVIPKNMETSTSAGGVKFTETDTHPERIHLKFDNDKYVAKTGDSFNGSITGVVSYGYSNFKVLTSKDKLPELQDGGTKREVTSIEPDAKKLTVASYNVENFSTKTDNEKLTKLAKAIVQNLKMPDIIGLTEMQDNDGEADSGTTDATESFKKLVAKIQAEGGPEYLFTDIAPEDKQDGGAPGGNIRVGFLYKKGTVSLTEGTKGKATESVGFNDGKLTLNPGRIDPTNAAFASSRKPLAAQFEFNGESVIVVANHFNSKGGDQPLFGKNQPPELKSEVQRLKIASIVNSFVKDIKSKDANANVVLLGDFNDFEFSKTLTALKGSELTNMVEKVPFEERYSYTYQGNSQVLDHILVSNNIAAETKVNIVHINSSFTEADGRASDHDPVLIQTELKPTQTTQPQKVYDLVGFTTKKLVVETPNSLVKLDATSNIKEGIWLKTDTTLSGEGLKKTKIIISPIKKETVIDFSGAEVKEVLIDNSNVKEIRGAENVQKWIFKEGIDVSGIKFYNAKGEAIASPFIPKENRPPVIIKTIDNLSVKVGEDVSLNLNNHFSDPDSDALSYSTTIGTVSGSILTIPTSTKGSYIVAVTARDKWESKTIATFSVNVTADNQLEPYYQKAEGKTGSELKTSLHTIIKSQTKLTYAKVWDAIKDTDEDPKNPNNVILLYSGKSVAKSNNGGGKGQWNREHVWAKSHGDFGTSVGPGTDIHHLRPEDVTVNSVRGHLDFDNGGKKYSGCECYYDTDSWEPPNSVKGDVARMIFYMAVRYEGDNGEIDLELSDTVNTYPKALHGKFSTLLEWNELDPVDDFERRRNDVIYERWQYNRNPFVDHPEWANEIWKAEKIQDIKKAS
ncbi:endonuclease [Peribacillus butanolivorans]|uniref:endonuclease n=1 Tax=Peribacillus butanolivorans TaxID=421767 RepID=UPI0035DCBE19